jgi:preprotein translocase subunit SecF
MAVKNIDYVGKFKIFGSLSLLIVVLSIVGFFTKGLNYGVDFRGGVEIQVKFHQKVELGELRSVMAENKVALSQLQSIGDDNSNEFLLKLESDKGDLNAVSNQVNLRQSMEQGSSRF